MFASEREYLTQISKLAERRLLFKLILRLAYRKLGWAKLEEKFGIRIKGAPSHGFVSFLYKRGLLFRNFVSFVVFSYNLCQGSGNVFDETYINSAEDTDLSIRANSDYGSEIISFRIGLLRVKHLKWAN